MFSIKIHIYVFMLNLRCESLENIFSLIFVRIPNTYVLVMVQLFFHVERVVDSTTITGTVIYRTSRFKCSSVRVRLFESSGLRSRSKV